MNRLPVILFVSGLGLVIALMIILLSRDPGVNYAGDIQDQRMRKNEFMKNDPASPFVKSGTECKNLTYFEPDPAFRLKAKLVPFSMGETVRMKMNDGTFEVYAEYAVAYFELQGGEHKLTIFSQPEDMNPKNLFLPFYDETSSVSTYGGGRYLEPEYSGGNEIVLDFNLAYNPYCAYVEGYICPLPPPENRIDAEINAGEKNYKTD
ncbi:MAG TPA: DUF1684 domain-containing protein [Cyclobacteriaceae bacterium]|nr:DUF1684 domain-containing protein [Cyclobacteriaceae bacterium]